MYSIEKQAQFLFEATHTAADATSTPEIRNSFQMVDLSQMQQSLKDNFKIFKQSTFEHLNDEVCYEHVYFYVSSVLQYK